jgi:hypothetical protein
MFFAFRNNTASNYEQQPCKRDAKENEPGVGAGALSLDRPVIAVSKEQSRERKDASTSIEWMQICQMTVGCLGFGVVAPARALKVTPFESECS